MNSPFKKVLVISDSFKETLSSQRICELASELDQPKGIEYLPVPIADGGEGTCKILTEALKGQLIHSKTVDPLGRSISAHWGWVEKTKIAIIELAQASGLQLLHASERAPGATSTFGTGIQIKQALDKGANTILIGLGGSATNDMGVGIASALGYQFKKKDNKTFTPTGENIQTCHTISRALSDPRILTTEFIGMCDVTNPLLGEKGAAKTFAEQKGANSTMIEQLESNTSQFIHHLNLNSDNHHYLTPGSGAAGGCGAGILYFLGGQLKSGFSVLSQVLNLDDKIKQSDFVITGEGCFDDQSLQGKVVGQVLELCRQHQKPAIIICGKSKIAQTHFQSLGINRLISLSERHGEQKSFTEPEHCYSVTLMEVSCSLSRS